MYIKKQQAIIRASVIIGIIVLLNIIFQTLYFRLDFTADKRYTLSDATKTILKNLDQPVTITAYFSEDVPPEITKLKKEFIDLVKEYESYSNHQLAYKFINPNENSEYEQDANRKGIYPMQLQSGSKDKFELQKLYLGILVQQGEKTEVIPAIQPGAPLEYALTFAIKKTTSHQKQNIAIIKGQQEAGKQQLKALVDALSVMYNVEYFKLDTLQIPKKYKAIAIINPTDTFRAAALKTLDNYVIEGGNVFIASSQVETNLQQGFATLNKTGIESWLASLGIDLMPNLVYDYDCREIYVQQGGGFAVPLNFPFLPNFHEFGNHPVSNGLENMVLPFASEIRYDRMDTNIKVNRLIETSKKSGTMNLPLYLIKQWNDNEFSEQNIPVAIAAEGKLKGEKNARLVVVSNGDFALADQQGRIQGTADNISFVANAMDWLADESGLVSLRTKIVTARPLNELDAKEQDKIKYLNLFAPILLLIIIGFIRYSAQKRKRKTWQNQ